MVDRTCHPRSAPGDFYVQAECCMSCMVVFEVAPDLFGQDHETGECFVQRQPTTETEVDRMLEAVRSAEARCVRYAGSNAEVIQKLVARGEQRQCDQLSGDANAPVSYHQAESAPAGRFIKWFKNKRDA
jgi:ferredoxin